MRVDSELSLGHCLVWNESHASFQTRQWLKLNSESTRKCLNPPTALNTEGPQTSLVFCGLNLAMMHIMSNRIMGHELVGSALCGQGRLHAPRGRCDGKSMKLNTKKAVEYKGRERLKMEKRQGTKGEWGWRRVNSRKGAEE